LGYRNNKNNKNRKIENNGNNGNQGNTNTKRSDFEYEEMKKIDEWINKRVKMIAEGFSLEQIQRECWDYCHREYLGILNLEAIIGRAMQLYAEVIKRSGV